jgi:hypothetical protein
MLLTAVGFFDVAQATMIYNTDVSPAVIMGTGINNGGFTVDRVTDPSAVELGLRARVRYENTVNVGSSVSGPGIYYYSPGAGSPLIFDLKR